MEKITKAMSLDKIFEVMRKVFKGVKAIYALLPSEETGDVVLVAKEDLASFTGHEYSNPKYARPKMAGWITSMTFVILEEVMDSKASLKKDAYMVSIPLDMFNDLNGFDEYYRLVPSTRYEIETMYYKLTFRISYLTGDLTYYKKISNGVTYETMYEYEKNKFERTPNFRGYEAIEAVTTKASYKGKEYTHCKKWERHFYFGEAPLSKKEAVFVIADDKDSEVGVAKYMLSRNGVFKALAIGSETYKETVSNGYSLSADERRMEEDFTTSTYTRYDWGQYVPVIDEELPEEVISNEEWKLLHETINLEKLDCLNAFVEAWEDTQWKEAERKADEYIAEKKLNQIS